MTNSTELPHYAFVSEVFWKQKPTSKVSLHWLTSCANKTTCCQVKKRVAWQPLAHPVTAGHITIATRQGQSDWLVQWMELPDRIISTRSFLLEWEILPLTKPDVHLHSTITHSRWGELIVINKLHVKTAGCGSTWYSLCTHWNRTDKHVYGFPCLKSYYF